MRNLLATALCFVSVSAYAQNASPYLALPAWDQKIVDASKRFVVSAGGASVLDNETGLVWQRTPVASTGIIWGSALINCHFAFTDARFGWRAPSIEELSSLFTPPSSLIIANNPFQGVVSGNSYWTSSSLETNPTLAYIFSVGSPSGVAVDIKTNSTEGYWCVRGGQANANPT